MTTTTTYRCVAGHEVPAGELPALTVEVVLDEGAIVLLCREHGTPLVTVNRQALAGVAVQG